MNRMFDLGERVIAAMHDENTGTPYRRQHKVAERAMDALFAAAEKPVNLCKFKNKYGWCKLDAGHEGSHTVISLGNEEDDG